MCLNISDPKQIATMTITTITTITAIKMQHCRAAKASKAEAVRVVNGHECVAYVLAAAAATVK